MQCGIVGTVVVIYMKICQNKKAFFEDHVINSTFHQT